MTSKSSKTLSERAVEAQANKTDICEELGLTKDEMKVISAYVSLIRDRINSAPVETLTAAAEKTIRKKFPNNERALEVVDQNIIDDAALKYVEDSAFGYPAGNLSKPAPVSEAKTQLARASAQVVASPADEYREVSYAKALKWLAQMQVQQQYKDALSPVMHAVHHLHRGYKWQAADRTEAAVPADESLAILMA